MKDDFDPTYGRTMAAKFFGVHRTTHSRWEKEGLISPPDGTTPTGDSRWFRSTCVADLKRLNQKGSEKAAA